jgi:alanyl-tRNA synthetase
MISKSIREKFFQFFIKHDHTQVASSSLVPAQDPTLLFANAGMNQFKDVFLGKETRSYTRAVSIQKCVRAGGKHNDLDNVGFTARHLTFFEMMGNFSFGDYFKKEAIRFAWDFLTRDMQLNPETLYASVYKKDDESYAIWHNDIGLPKERIYKLGEADNFWQMGDTGPCGPCSEIYVDRGIKYGCGKQTCAPGCSCDRFMEIWNLVFMQYNRQPDGTDKLLEKFGVDTGMGLERLCMIIEAKDSVFETDIFAPIMRVIEKETGLIYAQQVDAKKAAFNVVADHVRAVCFIIADGATPSNEGRGYVLRKIIRRGALFAKKLTDKNIFPAIADAVIVDAQAIYPELQKQRELIIKLLTVEYEKFASNLTNGSHILQKYMHDAKDKIISGKRAFTLYDTYGFPLEITRVIAMEQGFTVDVEGFDMHMQMQKEQSGKKSEEKVQISLPATVKTEFTGYEQLATKTEVIGIFTGNTLIEQLNANDEGWIITKQCPFYVERGGQISDKGWVAIGSVKAEVKDLKRIDGAIAIKIKTPVTIKNKQIVELIVDKQYRLDIMNNHTATHLLQAALIKTLGDTVRQSGSLVAPDYLRFDFTYHENLTAEQIKIVEDLVNEKIRENIPVSTFNTTYQKAMDHGVIAIFGEKYNPESVRVVDVPGFSAELCGGTHVRATGDIGCFKITEVSALSAGQRRIVALTGRAAVELFQDTFGITKKLSQEFKVKPEELVSAIDKQREALKTAESTIKQLRKEQLKTQIPALLTQVKEINSIPFLFLQLEEVTIDEMKSLLQELIQKKPGFYFVCITKPQTTFVAQVAPAFINKVDFKQLANALKAKLQLKAGGRDGLIQGGGPSVGVKEIEQLIIDVLS